MQAQPFFSACASTFTLSSEMLFSCSWNFLSSDLCKLAIWVANFDPDSFSASACVCKDARVTTPSQSVRGQRHTGITGCGQYRNRWVWSRANAAR